MCGIAGIVANRPINFGAIKAMTNQLVHRGPDGEGFWTSKNQHIAFGHRRLKIIDPSDRGFQPMVDPTGQYVINFNGAIYNYLELSKTLESKGVTFQSKCDTEVLLEAYKVWGLDCLSKLNGMFAFAIYDKKLGKIFCARDRFGEKPFLFSLSEDYFVFASEYKALFCLSEIDINIDEIRLLRFLDQPKQGLDTSHKTIFGNIFQLMPAEYMIIEVASMEVTRKSYWDVEPSEEIGQLNDKDASEHFRLLIEDSVRLRMRSDVPVGSALSGGLDSSSIVALNRKILGEGVAYPTFTGVFPGTSSDESQYAEIVRDRFDLIGHTVKPKAHQLIEVFDAFVWFNELPVGSASQYAQWCIFQKAKLEGIKVLLDGQGADEILGGYEQYFCQYLKSIKESCGEDVFAKEKLSIQTRYPLALGQNQYKNKIPFQVLWHFANCFGKGSQVLFGVSSDIAVRVKQANHRKLDARFNLLSRSLKDDALHAHLPTLLRYGDRNSMAHSIEVRLPFCDHRIAEFALSLKPRCLMGNTQTKHVLRLAMSNMLPSKIQTRWNKQGFLPPQDDWFRDSLINLLIDITNKEDFISRPYWKKNWWQKLIVRFKLGEDHLAAPLWKLLISEMWQTHFVDRIKSQNKILIFK